MVILLPKLRKYSQWYNLLNIVYFTMKTKTFPKNFLTQMHQQTFQIGSALNSIAHEAYYCITASHIKLNKLVTM